MAIHTSLSICGVMFSDTYPRCFAALLANASARFHFLIPAKLKVNRTYCSSRAASLVPNPSWVLNSLGTYFFRRRHTWSSNCVPVSYSFAFHFDHLTDLHLHMDHVAKAGRLFFFRTPTAKTVAPTLCTHRSVHIRCNFKPTSSMPHPTQPLSTDGGRSKNKETLTEKTMPPCPAKMQPTLVERKLAVWESRPGRAADFEDIAMGSLIRGVNRGVSINNDQQ